MSVAMHSAVPGAVGSKCYVLGERMVQTALPAVLKRPGNLLPPAFQTEWKAMPCDL